MIAVKVLLAYLLGNFLFTFPAWEKAKEKHKIAAWQLYVDALLQFALIMVLVYDLSFWNWALVITYGHLILETAQLYSLKENSRRENFLTGQAAHLLLIAGICLIYWRNSLCLNDLNWNHLLLIVTAVFVLTTPASSAIKIFISRWSPQAVTADTGSLQEAGKYIGILERLFVFFFIISGHWEGVGFLLAAKSIFRFGDLKGAGERTLTEYVLIGTLLSFGLAMLVGVVYLRIMV